MAKTKEFTKRILKAPTKVQPVWQIGILFPDGKKIIKPKCTLNDLFNTYFIKLEHNLNKNYNAEELYDMYEKTFKEKNIKIQINYIDSYSNKWSGKVAWPKKEWFIKYLNDRIND